MSTPVIVPTTRITLLLDIDVSCDDSTRDHLIRHLAEQIPKSLMHTWACKTHVDGVEVWNRLEAEAYWPESNACCLCWEPQYLILWFQATTSRKPVTSSANWARNTHGACSHELAVALAKIRLGKDQ
jgi:hypothetical protein